MPYSCSKETVVGRVFLNATKASSLLFLFFFHLFSSLFWYGQDSDYDDDSDQSDEDEDEEEEEEALVMVEEEGYGYNYRNNVQGELDDDFVSNDGMMRSCCSSDYYYYYPDDDEENACGEMQVSRDDKFLIFAPPGAESKKQHSAVGSHSITYKYDQEMISKSDRNLNPCLHDELESAYVAQICLTWEILSWDYTNFRCKLSLLGRQQGMASDPGFPAQVAQQFQQFQVLLRRYVENEPYESGKRPQIYARIKRNVAPKLLLLPQIQDYEDDNCKQDDLSSRISSASFLSILENSIRTFMDFLKADKESCCQAMITTLFRTRKGAAGSIDPALLMLMRKTNRMKKLKVKKLQRAGKCMRRREKVSKEEEMEMLMSLIDLKVVARVLRMWDLTRQQLRWCEEKMTKLTLSKVGHLHRDSSPLFFPPHPPIFNSSCTTPSHTI